MLLIVVAFDLSSLVRYITRFTEESFAALIALIFIFEAFKKLFHILHYAPITLDIQHDIIDYDCLCHPPNATAAPMNATGNNFYVIISLILLKNEGPFPKMLNSPADGTSVSLPLGFKGIVNSPNNIYHWKDYVEKNIFTKGNTSFFQTVKTCRSFKKNAHKHQVQPCCEPTTDSPTCI